MEKFKEENESQNEKIEFENLEITQEDIKKSEKNPYKAEALKRILGTVLCIVGYGVARRYANIDNLALFRGMAVLVTNTITLSAIPYISNYFGYKKFKKTHPGEKFDKHYYETQKAIDNYPYNGR